MSYYGVVIRRKIMIDKIFKTFFTKNKSSKCVTVIKNRQISEEFRAIRKDLTIEVLPRANCLAEYFKNRNGLNVKERLGSYLSKAQSRR